MKHVLVIKIRASKARVPKNLLLNGIIYYILLIIYYVLDVRYWISNIRS